MIRAIVYLLGLCIGLNGLTQVYAKPEIKPLPANIAEIGSEQYQFQTQNFKSADHKRNYKVWLGIPKDVYTHDLAKKHQYRSIFMLDGNASMSHLDEGLLKQINTQDAPVLVAIGYATNLPFETASRSVDYTPADLTTGRPSPDPRSPQRMSGGSADFQKLLLEEIAPWVEKQVQLDSEHRAIWGHSYGGLFVLDSMLMTNYFSHYFAASPSLSWADQRMLKKIDQFKITSVKAKHLMLMEGDVASEQGKSQSQNFDQDGIANNRKILAKFDAQGLDAKLLIYPNLKHGEVFKASLLEVLKSVRF